MNVLAISLDRTLVADGPVLGDSAWRQQQYAQSVEHLWNIVYSSRRQGATRHIAGNAVAYPTRSRSRINFLIDAIRMGQRLIHDQAVDLIVTQDPFATGAAGYWLKRRFGIPLNVMIFSSFFNNPAWVSSAPVNRILHALGKFIVKHADSIRVESPIEREMLMALGVSPERIWVVPLLVDLARFSQADGAAVRAKYPGRRLVLFAGRFVPEKNLPVLIHTAALLRREFPHVLMLLVGDGPFRSDLESLARQVAPESVEFTGVIPREELPGYFAASDAVVLPSIYEGIPTVLIEAAAAGKPIVTTPTRNVTDVVIPDETGFVVAASPEAFAHRIGFLLRNPTTSVAMGARGRELAFARFGPDRVRADITRMWSETVRVGRSAG